MNLTEKDFWLLLKSKLPGDPVRVENSTDDGMPDISICYRIDFWIELKVCNNKEKLRNVTSMLRDSQIVWNLRRGMQGSLIFVFVRYDSFIAVYRFDKESFTTIKKMEVAYKLVGIFTKNPGFDWKKINELLIRHIIRHLRLVTKGEVNNGLCCARTIE